MTPSGPVNVGEFRSSDDDSGRLPSPAWRHGAPIDGDFEFPDRRSCQFPPRYQ